MMLFICAVWVRLKSASTMYYNRKTAAYDKKIGHNTPVAQLDDMECNLLDKLLLLTPSRRANNSFYFDWSEYLARIVHSWMMDHNKKGNEPLIFTFPKKGNLVNLYKEEFKKHHPTIQRQLLLVVHLLQMEEDET